MKRRRVVVVAASLVGVCALVLGVGLQRMHARRTIKDVLPVFTEPGPGPRAPGARALGFTVGASTLGEVRAQLARAGLDCADTSMRALMQQAREQTRREMEARKARGQDPDAVSGASRVNYRSPKEANPQVRLACDDVPSNRLSDAERSTSTGRLLLVFDSPRHPLRHVSYERTFAPDATSVALADLEAARRRLHDLFGAPASSRTPAADQGQLPWLSPQEVRWAFADLEARVAAINYGPRGVVLSEVVEVPWPVRADAPGRAASAVAAARQR
jgi:hypothetical protein